MLALAVEEAGTLYGTWSSARQWANTCGLIPVINLAASLVDNLDPLLLRRDGGRSASAAGCGGPARGKAGGWLGLGGS